MTLAVVQKVSATGTAVSSIATSGITTTTGNLVVVGLGIYNGLGVFSSLADTASNTFTQIESEINAVSDMLRQYYVKNATGNASNVYTLTLTGNGYPTLGVIEISGADTTSPKDASGTLTGMAQTTSHVVSTSGATAQNDEIVVCCLSCVEETPGGSETFTADASYTAQNHIPQTATSIGYFDETRIISSTGVQTCTTTTATSASCNGIICTFKAAAAGGGTPLFRVPLLNGLGSGGPLFNNPLG